ncbi:MAG TPA: hypothetical protein VF723_09100 [Pyrinomonadaceae bacterium]|jgi:hypothetical protein
MRLCLILILSTLALGACGKNAEPGRNGAGNPQAGGSAASTTARPEVGDRVIYMFDEYHFYEARLLGIEGSKARLKEDDRTVERDLSDVYRIPQAGAQVSVKAGDFVAARYGTLPTWPTAEVVKVDGDKVSVRRIISGDVQELSAENVLAVSPAAAARIKEAAAKKP